MYKMKRIMLEGMLEGINVSFQILEWLKEFQTITHKEFERCEIRVGARVFDYLKTEHTSGFLFLSNDIGAIYGANLIKDKCLLPGEVVIREKMSACYSPGLLDGVRKRIKNMDFVSENHVTAVVGRYMPYRMPPIENVIYNNPATIVFWEDGTKTVVKTKDGESFDPEKGLAIAIQNKYLERGGISKREFREWLPEEEKLSESTYLEHWMQKSFYAIWDENANRGEKNGK